MHRAAVLLALGLILFGSEARAQLSGRVLDDVTGLPIVGAEVRLQARPDTPVAITNAAGQWSLSVPVTGGAEVGAALPYARTRPINYVTQTGFAKVGVPLDLRLPRLPNADNPSYLPPTAQLCGVCHVDQIDHWRDSRHAGAALNPWVLDLFSGTGTPGGSAGYVFRATHDPGETGFCATCHAPLEDVFTPGQKMLDEVSTAAGLDGVTCLSCHQIAHVDAGNINGLHHVDKTTYRFPDDSKHPTPFYVFGPLGDVEVGSMRNVYAPLFKQALLCASCHQYNNPATGAPGQDTFVEWQASPFAQPGPNFKVCQDCHMPPADGPGLIASTSSVIRPAEQRRGHRFVGSTPSTLAAAILLRTSTQVQGDQLIVRAEVENRGAGHAFPAGVSIRNALLVLDVRIAGQMLEQIAGPRVPWWANDEVPGVQPGDLAGLPGKGYAKVLEGRINGQGPVVRPVLFIDAEGVAEDSKIPSGQTDVSEYRFRIPFGTFNATATIDARLLYRRAFRAEAVTKGWVNAPAPNGFPWEIQVARETRSVSGLTAGPAVIPTLSPWALLGFAVLVMLGSLYAFKRLR